MKIKCIIFFLLIIQGCFVQRVNVEPQPVLNIINNPIYEDNKLNLKIEYAGIKYNMYEFNIEIRSKYNKPVYIDPSLFYYRKNSESDSTGNKIFSKEIIYSINPYEKVKQLLSQSNSLVNQNNPYSFTDKSSKQIIKEALISGTINALLGINPDEAEKQRLLDEASWNNDHNLQLIRINNELMYWNNFAMFPAMIVESQKIKGSVFFPVSKESKEIEIIINILNYTIPFCYSQLLQY